MSIPARKRPTKPTVSTKDRYEATFVVSNDANPLDRDFNNLQAAINALPPTGGKIFVKAGTYPLTSTILITTSNVSIQGEGMGITNFVAASSMTGNTPALDAFNPNFGTARTLLADTARGDISIQLAPADAASFAAGDYALLFSDKEIDTEQPDKHAGEVKRVEGIDPLSGTITFDDQIFDTYTTAQAAGVIRVSMLHNVALSDFSITTLATSSALNIGFTHFRFIDNLQITRIESHDAFHSGIQVQSVLNSRISDCYVHHISDVTPPQNVHYGIDIGGATQNLSIGGCRFSHTRHAITTGSSGGTNQNGVQRNIVAANCTSMLATTAHFDTHQPAENVTFTGCIADGGVPDKDVAVGFQMRARNTVITGCSVLQAVGKGIMLFGPASSGAVIAGNMIANVSAVNNKEGFGIFFDSAGTSNHSVTGNVIKNCDGAAIALAGANNDLVISGNIIENVNLQVAGAALQVSSGSRILISGNNLTGIATPVSAGADAVIVNNPGINPVGAVAHPWPASGDLTNRVPGGSGHPQSGVVYTVRQSPKTIQVSGGVVSQIAINGLPTGLTAGLFKLGIGETIAFTFTTVPTTGVFAE